jgi:uncharacterized protein
MTGSLNHLPPRKVRELGYVIDIICREFKSRIRRRTQPEFRNGKLLKIILYGSFARGDWVADRVSGYRSDYDLLIVVDNPALAGLWELWQAIDQKLIELDLEGAIRTPVEMIIHSLDDVNTQLTRGRYFFIDIMKEGIVLHDEDVAFVDPHPLPEDTARDEAQGYFDEWFESGVQMMETAEYQLGKDWLKKTAFSYHQAAESFYHCFMLTRTLYTPSTHRLNKLRSPSEALEPRLRDVWPPRKPYKRAYALLQDAYVKGRYSPHYEITHEELTHISARLGVLRDTVEMVCKEWLGRA